MVYFNVEYSRAYIVNKKWRQNNREKYRRYCIDRYRSRRAAFFKDKACLHCRTTENLCLHHRDPATKITSHNLWFWSKERALTETAKCDVLCRSCHQRMHMIQRGRDNPLIHGTRRYYDKGCRCTPCVKYIRGYWKMNREKKRW